MSLARPAALRFGGKRAYHTIRHMERSYVRVNDPLVNNPSATSSKLPDNVTLIHRPPPTAPSPQSLTTNPSSAFLRPPTPYTEDTPLPPTTRRDKPPAAGRVSQAVVQQIIALRTQDPKRHTRGSLSKRFGVTQSFVGMVAPTKRSYRDEALAKRDEEHAKNRAKWGERKQMNAEIRRKRKEFW